MSKIKGVVFDLDNTLLDFMKMKEFAVKSAVKNLVGRIKKFLMFFWKNKQVVFNTNFLLQA